MEIIIITIRNLKQKPINGKLLNVVLVIKTTQCVDGKLELSAY